MAESLSLSPPRDKPAGRDGIIAGVSLPPVASLIADVAGMSTATLAALQIGHERHRQAVAAAQLRVALAYECNGRDDCPSDYHLAACLRPTANGSERGTE